MLKKDEKDEVIARKKSLSTGFLKVHISIELIISKYITKN